MPTCSCFFLWIYRRIDRSISDKQRDIIRLNIRSSLFNARMRTSMWKKIPLQGNFQWIRNLARETITMAVSYLYNIFFIADNVFFIWQLEISNKWAVMLFCCWCTEYRPFLLYHLLLQWSHPSVSVRRRPFLETFSVIHHFRRVYDHQSTRWCTTLSVFPKFSRDGFDSNPS